MLVKAINPTYRTVLLRLNGTIADVSPCVALEDLPNADKVRCNVLCVQSEHVQPRSEEDMVCTLETLGLHKN